MRNTPECLTIARLNTMAIKSFSYFDMEMIPNEDEQAMLSGLWRDYKRIMERQKRGLNDSRLVLFNRLVLRLPKDNPHRQCLYDIIYKGECEMIDRVELELAEDSWEGIKDEDWVRCTVFGREFTPSYLDDLSFGWTTKRDVITDAEWDDGCDTSDSDE